MPHYEDGTAYHTSANVKYGFRALSKTGGNSGGNVNTVWVEAAKHKTQESFYMNWKRITENCSFAFVGLDNKLHKMHRICIKIME